MGFAVAGFAMVMAGTFTVAIKKEKGTNMDEEEHWCMAGRPDQEQDLRVYSESDRKSMVDNVKTWLVVAVVAAFCYTGMELFLNLTSGEAEVFLMSAVFGLAFTGSISVYHITFMQKAYELFQRWQSLR